MKKHKELLWTVIALLLAILSILAVASQSRELTFDTIKETLAGANIFWLLCAVICMLGYIAFEGFALYVLLKSTGFWKSMWDAITYAASDIYCSSITPSASGGQPVCAWFMKRDGIPTGYITAVLAEYLIMHTYGTLTIGISGLFADPATFIDVNWFAKILIVLGYLSVFGLSLLFLALLKSDKKINQIGGKIIDKLSAKGWVKRTDYWKQKLSDTLSDYRAGIKVMHGNGKVLFIVYIFNVLQRLSQTMVSTFMYLACGGTFKNVKIVYSAQCFSTIGSVCMPIPGGMGVADFLLFNGLHTIMDKQAALQLELMSRGFSFYLCVLVSMVIVVIGYFRRKNFYFTVNKKEK